MKSNICHANHFLELMLKIFIFGETMDCISKNYGAVVQFIVDKVLDESTFYNDEIQSCHTGPITSKSLFER